METVRSGVAALAGACLMAASEWLQRERPLSLIIFSSLDDFSPSFLSAAHFVRGKGSREDESKSRRASK